MNTNFISSMEIVLKEIIRLRGLAVMADGRLLTSMYCDLSNEKKDQRLLRYFVECGGHTALMDAQNLSPAMQKACFNQTVSKMCSETLVSDDVARQVCNTFWKAVYGRPMEEAAVPFQQEQKPQSQKTQKHNLQQVQKTQPVSTLPRPVPAVQKNQNEPVCRKKDFYLTKEEYHTGGNIAIYYNDGTKQIINFPPNAKNHQQGLPYEIHPGSGVYGNDLINYSDKRLKNYVSYGYLSDAIAEAADDVIRPVGWFILIPTVSYVADWIMETLFNFDLVKSIIISGFSVAQIFELIKNAFLNIVSFELNSFWSWFVLVWIGVLLVCIIGGVKQILEKRSSIRVEIERRKRL